MIPQGDRRSTPAARAERCGDDAVTGPTIGAVVTRGSLPVAPNVLIGRAGEVSTVSELLLALGARLVTLTGPPGVGKTRLAIAAAEAVVEEFEGGAVWVDLTPLREAGLVIGEIARVLQVSAAPAESIVARIAASLGGR